MAVEVALTILSAAVFAVGAAVYYLAAMIVFGLFSSTVMHLLQELKQRRCRRGRASWHLPPVPGAGSRWETWRSRYRPGSVMQDRRRARLYTATSWRPLSAASFTRSATRLAANTSAVARTGFPPPTSRRNDSRYPPGTARPCFPRG